jgi:hypothetical protein
MFFREFPKNICSNFLFKLMKNFALILDRK